MVPIFDPSSEVSLLNTFAQDLNIPIKTPKDVEKVTGIMEKLLAGDPIESMQIPEGEVKLINRVVTLKNMMTQSNLVNTIAMGSLKSKMEGMVAEKVEQLKSLKACRELCQEMLPRLSAEGAQSLIAAVEGFYLKGLSENLPHEKALVSALSKGSLRSVIRESDIDKNNEMKTALEADEKLSDYVCGISYDLVGSDAVFLTSADTANSSQRYRRAEIEDWLKKSKTDPITRAQRVTSDMVPDPDAEQIIRNQILPWVDLKTKDAPFPLERVQVLTGKSLLLAVAAAYPLIKEKYEATLEELHDTKKAMEKVEVFVGEIMSRATSLIEEISASLEQLPPSFDPPVKEFISWAALKTEVPLEEVKQELEVKMGVLIDFVHRIDQLHYLPNQKKEPLE